MPLSESVENIVKRIDAEISNRGSEEFAIGVGHKLFGLLIEAQIITSAEFPVSGTGTFEESRPAYRGRYEIWVGGQLGGLSFKFGKPLNG